GDERRAVVDNAIAVVVDLVARAGQPRGLSQRAQRRRGGAGVRAAHLAEMVGVAGERAGGKAVRADEGAVVAGVGGAAAGSVPADRRRRRRPDRSRRPCWRSWRRPWWRRRTWQRR